MAYQDLLSIDFRRVVKRIVDYVSREMPGLAICGRVLEVALNPDLDLLYIGFDGGRGSACGEYVGDYVHVFVRGGRVVAVEVVPFSKFMEEFGG